VVLLLLVAVEVALENDWLVVLDVPNNVDRIDEDDDVDAAGGR
jgi:hypothetical protein